MHNNIIVIPFVKIYHNFAFFQFDPSSCNKQLKLILSRTNYMIAFSKWIFYINQ